MRSIGRHSPTSNVLNRPQNHHKQRLSIQSTQQAIRHRTQAPPSLHAHQAYAGAPFVAVDTLSNEPIFGNDTRHSFCRAGNHDVTLDEHICLRACLAFRPCSMTLKLQIRGFGVNKFQASTDMSPWQRLSVKEHMSSASKTGHLHLLRISNIPQWPQETF